MPSYYEAYRHLGVEAAAVRGIIVALIDGLKRESQQLPDGIGRCMIEWHTKQLQRSADRLAAADKAAEEKVWDTAQVSGGRAL